MRVGEGNRDWYVVSVVESGGVAPARVGMGLMCHADECVSDEGGAGEGVSDEGGAGEGGWG